MAQMSSTRLLSHYIKNILKKIEKFKDTKHKSIFQYIQTKKHTSAIKLDFLYWLGQVLKLISLLSHQFAFSL